MTTWLVDLRHQDRQRPGSAQASVRKVDAFPSAGFLNGVATLDALEGIVLIADSSKGRIWSLNVWTGDNELLFTDLSMAGTATIPTGINGIRVRYNQLYFTNSAMGTFNVIPLDPKTGVRTGNATVISTGLLGPDDFEFDSPKGVAYVCNEAANQLLSIPPDGSQIAVVAELPGPTSAR